MVSSEKARKSQLICRVFFFVWRGGKDGEDMLYVSTWMMCLLLSILNVREAWWESDDTANEGTD